MNDYHGASAWRDSAFESVKIDLPAVIVHERVADEFYVLNFRQELEKRIARPGN